MRDAPLPSQHRPFPRATFHAPGHRSFVRLAPTSAAPPLRIPETPQRPSPGWWPAPSGLCPLTRCPRVLLHHQQQGPRPSSLALSPRLPGPPPHFVFWPTRPRFPRAAEPLPGRKGTLSGRTRERPKYGPSGAGGSVGEASALGSGHGPSALGSSPARAPRSLPPPVSGPSGD